MLSHQNEDSNDARSINSEYAGSEMDDSPTSPPPIDKGTVNITDKTNTNENFIPTIKTKNSYAPLSGDITVNINKTQKSNDNNTKALHLPQYLFILKIKKPSILLVIVVNISTLQNSILTISL